MLQATYRISIRTLAALFGLLMFFYSAVAQSDKIFAYLFSFHNGEMGSGGSLNRSEFCSDYSNKTYLNLSYADYFREGGLEVNNANFSRFMLQGFQFNFPEKKYFFQVNYGKSITEFSDANLNQDQSVRALVENDFLNIKAEYKVNEQFNFSTAVNLKRDIESGFGFGLHGKYSDWAKYKLLWQRDNNESFAHTYYEQNPIFLAISSQHEISKAALEIQPLNNFTFHLSGKNVLWIPNDGDSDKPELRPFGKEQDYKIRLNWKKNRHDVFVGGRGIKYNLSAYGYQNSLSFSKITVFDLSIYSLFAGYEINSKRSNYLFEFETSDYYGRFSGHIETWPYTNTITDLLGTRVYGYTKFKGDLYRLHFAFKHQFGKRFTMSSGLNLIDFHTDTIAEMWRWHLFIPFDFEHFDLEVTRIQGGMLSFGFDYRISNVQLQYSFAQLFPIKIWKKDYGTIEPGEPPESKFQSQRAYGGGFHNLSLIYHF